jgi:hypothetical protein
MKLSVTTLRSLMLASLMAASGAAVPAHAVVVINPLFASSYTCPQAVCGLDPSILVSLQGEADAQAAINAAAAQIGAQFHDDMTANILFYGVHGGAGGFLSASIAGQTAYSYDQFADALAADAAAHPQNTVLNAAVAHLGEGNGAGDPNAFVAVNTPDARVLGLGDGASTAFGVGDSTPQFSDTGDFLGGGGVADGIVLLNLDQPLAYSRPVPDVSSGVFYDAESAMEHEIDEILGIGGGGSQLNNFAADPNYAEDFFGVSGSLYGGMDLYRYAAPGTPSFDPFTTSITGCGGVCSGDPSPYFSVDGGKHAIDTFNQGFPLLGGDAGDWGLYLFALCPGDTGLGGSGDVQDAFVCNNRSPDVRPGAPAFAAFEAIGYNGVPEPAAWLLMVAGVGGLGAVLRRRHAQRAAA